MSDLSRRSLLCGLIAAPAVIRVAPLMRISVLEDPQTRLIKLLWATPHTMRGAGLLIEEQRTNLLLQSNTFFYGNSHPHIFEPVRFEKLTTVALDG